MSCFTLSANAAPYMPMFLRHNSPIHVLTGHMNRLHIAFEELCRQEFIEQAKFHHLTQIVAEYKPPFDDYHAPYYLPSIIDEDDGYDVFHGPSLDQIIQPWNQSRTRLYNISLEKRRLSDIEYNIELAMMVARCGNTW